MEGSSLKNSKITDVDFTGTNLTEVNFIMSFVQALKYSEDNLTAGVGEYPRYPIETLVEQTGDCEDTSALLISILESVGYETVMILIPEAWEDYGHAAVGVNVEGASGVNYILNENQNNEIRYLNDFKGNKKCFVAGSTWEKDESLIIKFINSYEKNDVCFIIAPHQINLNRINELKQLITKNTILMSELAKSNAINPEVIIIDSIGILTKVYSYGDIAYVGGGMGNTGLHNTLEPAVYKIPIIIGNNFEKFPEVKELIDLKGMISINNIKSFTNELNELLNSNEKRDQMGNINYDYINANLGACEKVINYLKEKK